MAEFNKKYWFSVRVEGIAPITVEYRIFAENEDEAFQTVEKLNYSSMLAGPPQPQLHKIQKKKVLIKNILTGMINWIRHF